MMSLDFSKLNKTELQNVCRERGLRGFSKLKKEALIGLLSMTSDVEESPSSVATPADRPLKFIDLFCGIGGFHQAMMPFGTCVFASDIDKACREVYLDNYGIEPAGDITKVDVQSIPDFDVLCGGFPCQPFSNGGKKRTFNDSRGLLFDHIIRIARAKRPKFMFLENVKHILEVDNKRVIEYIKKEIEDAGYNYQKDIISPHEFGVPQQRERVYFICIRKDVYDSREPYKFEKKDMTNTYDLDLFLESSPDLKEYGIPDEIGGVLNAWDELIRRFDVGEVMSPTILVNDAYRDYTEQQLADRPAWKKEYMKKNERLLEKYRDVFDEWYARHSDILRKREIYGKLEWQAGVKREGDTIFDHFIQIRQSGIRVKKCRFFPTLVAISQIPIYGKQRRYITPRECARLQSFPDSFKIHPSDRQSYKQFGNCVNVKNASDIIRQTLAHYSIFQDRITV